MKNRIDEHQAPRFGATPAAAMPSGRIEPKTRQASEPAPFGLFDRNRNQRDEVAQMPLFGGWESRS